MPTYDQGLIGRVLKRLSVERRRRFWICRNDGSSRTALWAMRLSDDLCRVVCRCEVGILAPVVMGTLTPTDDLQGLGNGISKLAALEKLPLRFDGAFQGWHVRFDP